MENKWEISSALFVCPLCGNQIKASKSSIFCKKGHCYDISKKGYINFVQTRSMKIYSAELFKNRSLLYSNGFYDKIIETMNLLIVRHVCDCNNLVIVDAGCGEGTFLIRLCNQMGAKKIGFDISKDAILQASRSSKEILWMVADLVNIPISDNSVDVLFNIFTPANYQSFARILKKNGVLIKVIPGTDYLKEIREVSETLINKQRDNEEQVVNYLSRYMKIVEKKKVYYKVNVNLEQLQAWIKMTPMMANVIVDTKELLGIKQVTVDVTICVCRKLEVV